MNDIMKLKNKYPCPTSDEIFNAIEKHKSTTDSFIKEHELRFTEDQKKIEDLCNQLSILKEKLDNEKKMIGEKTMELRRETEKLKGLEKEKNRIMKSNQVLERKCHKLRNIRPNPQDQYILDLGQKKYNLYKQLTRIRWEFGELDEATKGYKKDYIKPFCYPKEIQGEELSDLLWKEIELSLKKTDQDEVEKENNSSN